MRRISALFLCFFIGCSSNETFQTRTDEEITDEIPEPILEPPSEKLPPPSAPIQNVTSVSVFPRIQNYGPGSLFRIQFEFTTARPGFDASHFKPVLLGETADADIPIENNYALSTLYAPSAFTVYGNDLVVTSETQGETLSGKIFWASPFSTPPGKYKVGLRNLDNGEATYIADVELKDTPWALIHGDGDASNVNIGFVGDRWPSEDSYHANLIKTSAGFIEGDPVISNYSPSINIVAKRSITGLGCHRCQSSSGQWDSACGVNPKNLTGDILLASIAGVVAPVLFPIALVGSTSAQIVSNIIAGSAGIFMCDVSEARNQFSSSPLHLDTLVIYSNGSDSEWFRSHVGTIPTNLTDFGLQSLGLKGWDNHDVVFLGTDRAETKEFIQARLETNTDGAVLIHEFGHTFGGLPDFYNWDTFCDTYRGRMCDHRMNFASPKPAGWEFPGAPANKAYDKIAMVDAFNRRLGDITSISTGLTFPNPSSNGQCTGKKFQVSYKSTAKEDAYLTMRVFDIQGRQIYAYASERAAPRTPGEEIKFGFYVTTQHDWRPGDIGYGYPHVNQDFSPTASGMYFFSVFAGNLKSATGDGNKNTWLGSTVSSFGDRVCSPQL
jgi:hypothetical protein